MRQKREKKNKIINEEKGDESERHIPSYRAPSGLCRQGNATISERRVPEGREERTRQSTSICQPLSKR